MKNEGVLILALLASMLGLILGVPIGIGIGRDLDLNHLEKQVAAQETAVSQCREAATLVKCTLGDMAACEEQS